MNEVTVSIPIKTMHCYVNLNFVAQYSAWTNASLLSISLCAMFSFSNTHSRWRWSYRSYCHLLYLPFLQPYSNLPFDSSALKLRILWWSLHGDTLNFSVVLCLNSLRDYPKETWQNPCFRVVGFSYITLFFEYFFLLTRQWSDLFWLW